MTISLSAIIILSILALINIVAFLVMMIDKGRSANPGLKRISEGQIFFMAALFGGLGVYAGMLVFRHKTKHRNFLVLIPLALALNLGVMMFAIYVF